MQEMKQNEYIQEDEIDLKELFQTILQYKYKIALFAFIVTTFTVLYTLTKPNEYKSSITLTPQGQSKPSSLGGLSALAGIAGVDLGGNEVGIYTLLDSTLKDFSFNQSIIEKYDLTSAIDPVHMKKNMVFALGYDGLYNLVSSNKKQEVSDKDKIYNTYNSLKDIISIQDDKASGLITITAYSSDRFLAKQLVDIYLKELTTYIRKREMKEINKKIQYYKNELSNTNDIALKQQLSVLITNLVQKSVLSKANEYYNVSIISNSRVAHIKEKTKPKRALTVIVSFIASIAIGIFGVFFIEFLKNKEENTSIN